LSRFLKAKNFLQEVLTVAVVEISIVPLGTGSTSLSPYVAACERELRKHSEGLKYELTAMGTIIEGDLDQIITLVRRLHEVPFEKGALRVSTSIKIDDRRDKPGTIEQKVRSVEDKL
jgi:uncharacterized protein (TIGR00106 family)